MIESMLYLEPVQLGVVIWLCQTCKHKVVRILQEILGITNVGAEIWGVVSVFDGD